MTPTHQALQRDFQEKLKGKEKEITKLSRDNLVFQRWKEEDVKKIRALESRVKDLEQQVAAKAIIEKDAEVLDAPLQDSKRRTSTTAAKSPTVQKTRPRAHLTRTGSDSAAAARTYKQVLERYALGASKQQHRATQLDKIAFDQSRRDELSYDGTNQLEDLEDDPSASGTSPPMARKPQWETRVDDSQAASSATSGLCVSPVLCPVDDDDVVSRASVTKHSWTYSNLSSTMASFGAEWASSLLSRSTPAILTQKHESNERRDLNVGSASAPKQESAQLLKNASTGSISYSSPLRAPVASGVELCQKHKLAGCMLCSVNDSFRLTPAAPAYESTTVSIRPSSKLVEVTRKAHDGLCDRHQLLRCFICLKGATASSSSSSTVDVASTSNAAPAPPSYRNYSIAATNSSINYQGPRLPGETHTKCALHSLANCILCAGVKAITRKVVAPTPQASPAKAPGLVDTRSGGHLADERSADRFRRYTLDERILQAKLASHW